MTIQINGTSGISGVDGSAGTPALQGTDTNTGISFGTDEVNINTGGTTRATVDSSGRVLVGTSSTAVNGDAQYAKLQLVGNTLSASGYSILNLARGEYATSVTNGEALGTIQFTDNTGNAFAHIFGIADGTAGAADYPGRLVFSTTADGASSPTERMRITNAGAISCPPQVSGSDLEGPEACGFVADGTYAPIYKIKTALTSLKWAAQFHNGNGQVGSISMNGSATSFTTSSDYRLKENVVPLTGAADRLNQLQVHRFNFIADPDTTVDGFIAHEAQAVVPEAVTGTHDEVDDDGNPVYQGIDQSKLVPLLTAALQEALAKIETLETRLTALEGGTNP